MEYGEGPYRSGELKKEKRDYFKYAPRLTGLGVFMFIMGLLSYTFSPVAILLGVVVAIIAFAWFFVSTVYMIHKNRWPWD